MPISDFTVPFRSTFEASCWQHCSVTWTFSESRQLAFLSQEMTTFPDRLHLESLCRSRCSNPNLKKMGKLIIFVVFKSVS